MKLSYGAFTFVSLLAAAPRAFAEDAPARPTFVCRAIPDNARQVDVRDITIGALLPNGQVDVGWTDDAGNGHDATGEWSGMWSATDVGATLSIHLPLTYARWPFEDLAIRTVSLFAQPVGFVDGQMKPAMQCLPQDVLHAP
jgi:hypothetical protein